MKYSYKKNRLLQLRGFCTVIEEGSILKASQKMNTAQSNVSLQISTLERDLKVTLFKREKQRLIPTPEALRFYKISKKSIQDMDMIFENAMQAIQKNHENTIKIAGYPYMLSHILPDYFKKVLEINSDISFELWNVPFEEAFDMLSNGLIDIAVYPIDPSTILKGIDIHEFYHYKVSIGMHKNHPLAKVKAKSLTWSSLAKYDFVTLGTEITLKGLKTIVETYGINSKFILHNGTWEMGMGLIKKGLTISCGDLEYAKWHKDIIVKKLPSDVTLEYKFCILTSRELEASKASNELLQILKQKS